MKGLLKRLFGEWMNINENKVRNNDLFAFSFVQSRRIMRRSNFYLNTAVNAVKLRAKIYAKCKAKR